MAAQIATTESPKPGTVLDCGHVLPEPAHQTCPEYGRSVDGRYSCWPCCHKIAIEELKSADRVVAYLSIEPRPHTGPGLRVTGWRITTWPGADLMTVTALSSARVGFRDATGRRPLRYTVHATDLHGQKWIGRGPGEGMYLRLIKAKPRLSR